MNLLYYANLANAAYTTRPDIGDESSSARAVVSINGDGFTLGFPGTNNGSCVETDIDAFTFDAGVLGNVHSGTYEALQSIWGRISPLQPDVVFGHSLGGMLAILCGARLCAIGKPPKIIYAFEPAKLSTDDKIKTILAENNVKVIIVRNGKDVIPLLPEIPFEDWQHCAALLSVGKASLPIPNVEDHLMANVIDGITAHLRSTGEI
jgi:triacylglycerol lipase